MFLFFTYDDESRDVGFDSGRKKGNNCGTNRIGGNTNTAGKIYYSCEIIDEKTKEVYVLDAKSEREAKAYCLLFEKGDTYTIEIKWISNEQIIIDFEEK